MDKKTINKVIEYWRCGSEQDWEVARNLFKLKHYHYTLFFCHLTLEKMIKAIVVLKTQNQSPYIHDLYTLILKANIKITSEQKKNLEVVNTFNIRARYDNIKHVFYKKANKNYTERYLKICDNLRIWLKKELTKK
ncbi:HEPN domain-containing protein [Patescibacteria group bacterium]